VSTTRLSPELLAEAEIVGAHSDGETPEVQDKVVNDKVVRKTSRGVKTK